MSTAPEAQKPAKPAKADVKAEPKVTAKSKAKAEAAAIEKAAAAAKPAKAPKAAVAKKPPVKKAKAAKPAARPAHSESRLAQVLIAPIVSEKATMAAEKHNQVLFKVMRDATKPEIKAAVELMFSTQVKSVSIVNVRGKEKRSGRFTGRRNSWKKAYVALAAGQEINFAEGENK
jgi:large subunit ribosomal protein L23